MEECVICFGKLDSSVTLKCSHKFHKRCINQWKNKSNTCPTCRRPILIIKTNHAYFSKIPDFLSQYTYSPKETVPEYTYIPSEYNSLYTYDVRSEYQTPDGTSTSITLVTSST